MSISLINVTLVDATKDADRQTIALPPDTTFGSFKAMYLQSMNLSKYTVTVNGCSGVSDNETLKANDRITLSPKRIDGAA